MLVVTHEMGFARNVSSKTVFMENGVVVEQAPSHEFFAHPREEMCIRDRADIAAVREEFLPRYYLDDEQIPKIIAVDELPPDSEVLQQALNEKRGSEVQLYVPQQIGRASCRESV